MDVPLTLESLLEGIEEAPSVQGPERSFDQLIKQLRAHARKLKWHRHRLQVGIDELKALTQELGNELMNHD